MTVARPPRSWELQTLTVFAAAAAATFVNMITLVEDLALRHYVVTGGADGLSPMVAGLVDHRDDFAFLRWAVIMGFFIGYEFWLRRTRQMLTDVGDTGTPVAAHWATLSWYATIGLSILIRVNAGNSGDLAGDLTVRAVQAALGVIALSCLMIGVWQIREETRRRVAAAGVQLRFDTGFARHGSAGDSRPPVLPAYQLLTAATAGDSAVADDAFWTKVAGTATGLRADLPLLECTGLLTRRWLLVPADGDLVPVRGGLTTGAEITVFPRSPSDTPTKGYTPLPAEAYHGFLEGRTGALTYESVSARRVPAFLAQAKRARRWALYPDADPTAMTARVYPGA